MYESAAVAPICFCERQLLPRREKTFNVMVFLKTKLWVLVFIYTLPTKLTAAKSISKLIVVLVIFW